MKLLKDYTHKIIILFFAVFMSHNIYGQAKADYSVTKITLMSTACPGLGQVYNKKYSMTLFTVTNITFAIKNL